MRQERQVKSVILETIKKQKMLSAGILTLSLVEYTSPLMLPPPSLPMNSSRFTVVFVLIVSSIASGVQTICGRAASTMPIASRLIRSFI